MCKVFEKGGHTTGCPRAGRQCCMLDPLTPHVLSVTSNAKQTPGLLGRYLSEGKEWYLNAARRSWRAQRSRRQGRLSKHSHRQCLNRAHLIYVGRGRPCCRCRRRRLPLLLLHTRQRQELGAQRRFLRLRPKQCTRKQTPGLSEGHGILSWMRGGAESGTVPWQCRTRRTCWTLLLWVATAAAATGAAASLAMSSERSAATSACVRSKQCTRKQTPGLSDGV